MNGQGKSSHPSSLVGEIRKLFPKLVQKEETSIEHQVWTCRDGLQQLIAGFQEAGDKNLDQLRKIQGGFLELFRHFYGKEEYKKLVEKLTDAAFLSMKIRGSDVRQPGCSMVRTFREALQGWSSLQPAPMPIS